MYYLPRLLSFTTALTFLLCELSPVLAASFDQRQTGDINVQIDLKNFKIFALTKGKEEYVDYDYAYDYSEMTIKPQNGITTTKPLYANESAQIDKDNTTVTPLAAEFNTSTKEENNATITTEKVIISSNPTIGKATTETPATTIVPHDTTSYNIGPVTINSSSTEVTSLGLKENNETLAENNNTTSLIVCKKGYYRNSKGNCELSLQNPSYNILLKMLQKSKSSAMETRNHDITE